MIKSGHLGHTKMNPETQSRRERRKELRVLGKQDDKFNKLLDKLKQNARRDTKKGRDDNG
jgi:hypothetical protein